MEGDGELETESVELSNLKNIIKNDWKIRNKVYQGIEAQHQIV